MKQKGKLGKFSLEMSARGTVFSKAEGTLKPYEAKKATFEVQYFFTFEEWQVNRWSALGPACELLPLCLHVITCLVLN